MPAPMRFSVQMPRSIAHESHLKRFTAEAGRFYDSGEALQPKLAPIFATRVAGQRVIEQRMLMAHRV
jgi:uncharacterized protein YecE (DUF72 family)